ncbi:polyadenylate-binding protein [Moniliophthora roreri]|nr:polyadenylate-binding protein [Moniliophthora roreri]
MRIPRRRPFAHRKISALSSGSRLPQGVVLRRTELHLGGLMECDTLVAKSPRVVYSWIGRTLAASRGGGLVGI